MYKEVRRIINLIKEKTELSQKEIAERMGVHPNIISDLANGRKSESYTAKFLEQLKRTFDLPKETTVATDSVPFFDEEIFTGGILQGTGDAISLSQKVEDVRLPFLKVKDGDFAVQVRGRSMIDTDHPELSINDGAIVCLRPWNENFIEYGERYAIATRSGFTVKYIAQSDKEGFVKCVPANKGENFAPYYINKSDITGFARVTAIINMQIL